MKKFILLVLIFLFYAEYANADDRFKAGTWDLSIGSSASDLSIIPSIGYFLLDNVEGIVHVDYSKLTYDYPPDFSDSEVTNMMVSADLIYHIPTQSNPTFAISWLNQGNWKRQRM
jgi:hypothetical protein